jgi:hypothetical protein
LPSSPVAREEVARVSSWFGLAVDDRGEAGLGVTAHALPHAHDVAAGGVDDHAAALLDALHELCLGAEGGHDDDVVLVKLVIAASWLADREC